VRSSAFITTKETKTPVIENRSCARERGQICLSEKLSFLMNT